MANGTPPPTGNSLVDTWAKVITTVGFPVVAASVLIYVLVVQQAKATGEIAAKIDAVALTTERTQDLVQKQHEMTLARGVQLDEVLSRLRMQMGEDPWVRRAPTPPSTPDP